MRHKKRSLGLLSTTVLVFNGIAVILLLLSYLAPIIQPQTFWPIAFMGISYPIFLCINILFVLFWLFRKPSMALVSLVAIAIGWKALNKNIGFNKAVQTTERTDTSLIRVMSYNVQLFKNKEADGKKTQDEVIKLIGEVSPDVLCIQEFYTRNKGKANLTSYFSKKLGLKFSYFIPVAKNEYDAYGIVIFSRYPIIQSGTLDINRNERIVNRIVFADIERGGKKFRVYNVHLQSVGFQKEDYNFITKDAPAGNVDVQSTKRIGRRLKSAYIKRNDQIDLLYSHTQETETPYIVAGDFNDTPLSYSVNRLTKDMKNAFEERGRGLGVTYNGAFPNFQIDYILASNDFQVENFQIISEKYSDHYPIWSDLKL